MFTAGGVVAGLYPLGQTFWSQWMVREWQPVQAQVLDVKLHKRTDSEGVLTHLVEPHYRYLFAGQNYEGKRMGLQLGTAADNLGDWHQRWYETLRRAKQQGASIQVWVNPQDPKQSLIDREIRWPMMVFHLPFALVFTGIGLGAAWFFWRTLVGATETPKEVSIKPRNSLAASAVWIWIATLFWCGVSFPMAFLFWSDKALPWWPKLLMGVFVAIGVCFIYAAIRTSLRAWHFKGLGFTVHPGRPVAGQTIDVTLVLPVRAASRSNTLRVQLAQYRTDEVASGASPRRVEELEPEIKVQPTPEGGLRILARFKLPEDAPTHGSYRDRERVDWRMELLNADGSVELDYDLPVQALPARLTPGALDRHGKQLVWKQETPIALPEPDVLAPSETAALPPNISLRESTDGWELVFPQTGWRKAALVALVLLVLEWIVSGRLRTYAVHLPQSPWGIGITVVLLAFALHAATRQWFLRVQDDGIVLSKHSLLWSRRMSIPGDASKALVQKLLYISGSGTAHQKLFYAVHAGNGLGGLLQLTPGVNGESAVQALGQAIARAWQDRQGRFSAGVLRSYLTDHSRPCMGWLLILGLLAVLIWGTQAREMRTGGASALGAISSVFESPRQVTPVRVVSAADESLMNAQDASDPIALEQALRDGANPNLLSDTGSSMLMLAALRGQMEHVELLLRAGAEPDLRQTIKPSELGDTALLRALYGGHLAIAQRLVQAGASLDVRNRWDWGPVHMAAQSGCVPCLQWLSEQGQSLNSFATASRGETPAMLAASKGQVPVLEWLHAKGVDLWVRDSHGMNVMDWARFRQQIEAERWLQQRVPPKF
jgi:hypothetical protein